MRFHVSIMTAFGLALTLVAGLTPQACQAEVVGGGGVNEPPTVAHLFGNLPNDGTVLDGTMVMANGILYGTTTNGGPSGFGSIYQITPLGQYKQLYNFPGADVGPPNLGMMSHAPSNPSGPLATVGTVLYGTTKAGGFYNNGVLFKFDTQSGNFTVVHNFGGFGSGIPNGVTTDGNYVVGSLQTAGSPVNTGGVFAYNISTGTTTVYPFNTGLMRNSKPSGPPIPFGTGTFAGVTSAGGFYHSGTIYTFSPATGSFTYVYSFTGVGADSSPLALMAVNRTLFGVTGSASNAGELFSLSSNASLPDNFSILHDFGTSGGTDPYLPTGAPSFVSTESGWMLVGLLGLGGNGFGGVYTVGLDGGNYAVIHDFTGTDSGNCDGGLVTGPDGNLWGTGNPNAYKSSVFRLGPQLSYAAPIATDVNNGGLGDLFETINGSGFASNITAMFDNTPVTVTPGGTSIQVTLQISASLLTKGAHVITLYDPNVGSTSNTLVVDVGEVHLTPSFGTVTNNTVFQDMVKLTNSGYGTASNAHIVSAELRYSNGNVVPLVLPAENVNIPAGDSALFTLKGSGVEPGGTAVLLVHWAYNGGSGGAAIRLNL
jgi:uncharacterized repeat protein (TIGR03803 family)